MIRAISHLQCVHVARHVVRAHDPRAVLHRTTAAARPARYPRIHVAPGDRTDHAFARQPDQHRTAELASSLRRRSSARLCSSVLPKPKPGSIDDTLASDARASQHAQRVPGSPHFRYHVFIMGSFCIVGGSPRMCIRHTATSAAAAASQRARIAQRAHVVDHRSRRRRPPRASPRACWCRPNGRPSLTSRSITGPRARALPRASPAPRRAASIRRRRR